MVSKLGLDILATAGLRVRKIKLLQDVSEKMTIKTPSLLKTKLWASPMDLLVNRFFHELDGYKKRHRNSICC